MMKKLFLMLVLVVSASRINAAQPVPAWKAKLATAMPLMGHRNWVLVVDSAYPLQTSPGVDTIETNADQMEVVRAVLATVNASIHVRPVIFMDAELPYITEKESPGVTAYRKNIGALLANYKIESMLHEKLIANINEAGKTFHILVLKTKLTVPYTSVFIRLDCKYWSADEETDLRARMKADGK